DRRPAGWLWGGAVASEAGSWGEGGRTGAGRPSRRYGIEIANYYTPRPWMILDGDIAWSSAHFTDVDPAGHSIPGSVATVVSAGVTVDGLRNPFGSARLRYVGPRPLIEDNSVRSKATGLGNLEGGYKLSRPVKLRVDVFNLFDAKDSDVDYYYASRLPGEPLDGINDVHFHPTLPRAARVNLVVGF